MGWIYSTVAGIYSINMFIGPCSLSVFNQDMKWLRAVLPNSNSAMPMWVFLLSLWTAITKGYSFVTYTQAMTCIILCADSIGIDFNHHFSHDVNPPTLLSCVCLCDVGGQYTIGLLRILKITVPAWKCRVNDIIVCMICVGWKKNEAASCFWLNVA